MWGPPLPAGIGLGSLFRKAAQHRLVLPGDGMAPGRLRLLRGALARLAEGRVEADVPEMELEAARMLRSQAVAARARRMRKLMEPPGPPKRTLSCQAMEQMRYLSREWPEEWPVDRLARGFQVQPEVVRRVLKSRFCPSPERRRKQDARVVGGSSHQSPIAREATFRLLHANSAETLARLAAPQAGADRAPTVAQRASAECRRPRGGDARCNGQLLSEASGEPRQGVVQRGREIFDSDGKLLYRIPRDALTVGDATSSEESQ